MLACLDPECEGDQGLVVLIGISAAIFLKYCSLVALQAPQTVNCMLDMLYAEAIGPFKAASLLEHRLTVELDIVLLLEVAFDSVKPSIREKRLRMIFTHSVSVLLLEKCVDYGCGDDALLQIVEGWLAKLCLGLCEVENVVMYLERDAEVSAKVKQTPVSLRLRGEAHKDTDTAAPQADHRRCLVVRLGNVGLKVGLRVELSHQRRFVIVTFEQPSRLLHATCHVSLGLNELAIDKVAENGGEELAHVHTLWKDLSQHATGAGYHKVAGEDGSCRPEHLMGSLG